MSRVYDALCQSQREKGLTPDLLSLESYEPDPSQEKESPLEPVEAIATFRVLAQPHSRLVALNNGSTLGAEKFRLLRARLRHMQERQSIKTVVITSGLPEEGKTVVAMNLAVSLAKTGSQKVLLLEGDLHKPALAERIGLSGYPGLGEWLPTERPIREYLYRAEEFPLWVLPVGNQQQHPMAVLQSARFAAAWAELVQAFDWVIVDAPPLLPLADVNFWAKQADGLLLVVRQAKGLRRMLQKGLETLDHARVLGVVLNFTDPAERAYYTHYYTET
jgi:capsular exopolysaccharide synthesis family protein